jgi:hypothetical protein
MSTGNILDSFVRTAPSVQNALDIFAGEWASRLPPPLSTCSAGGIPLFEDSRIIWALQELGGCSDQRVLELGPLEGGHSYMLESQGAASVTAVEGNTRAFLKCLLVKEILGLKRVNFLCGDFIEYLQETQESFDLIFASGVLYHMKDPFRLIELLARRTDRMYVWTHYYDEKIIRRDPNLRPKFPKHSRTDAGGFPCTLHRQEYQGSLKTKGFCGGSEQYSFWLERADILTSLASHGFSDVRIGHEQPDHPHGPCFGLVATK